jgi:hypothetical protein
LKEKGKTDAAMTGSSALIAAAVVLTGTAVLSGCAHRSSNTAGAPAGTSEVSASTTARSTTARPTSASGTTARPTPTTTGSQFHCPAGGSGFDLVPAGSGNGARSPVAAAQEFVRHGGMSGYGTADSRWQLIDPGRPPGREAAVVDGNVSLRALQFPDGTWVVDQGMRCT